MALKKYSFLLLLLFFIFFHFYCFPIIPCAKASADIILIDPGHGGHDLGAIAKLNITAKSSPKKTTITILEKDLSLRLALLLREELQEKFTVYLTRLDDRYVSLEDRSSLADKVKATLFISLHFNSTADHTAQGIETYYLDNHQDKAVKKVEAIENAEISGTSPIVNHILIDLAIKMTTRASKDLAMLVHQASVSKIHQDKYPIKDRGYKPGLLYVLALSKRPGILIEGGFMSNSKELERIHSDSYLKSYAKGIAVGVKKFFEKKPPVLGGRGGAEKKKH